MHTGSLGKIIRWHQPPRRPDLLNAHRLVAQLQPMMHVVRRDVAAASTFPALMDMLLRRRAGGRVDRYRQEAYLLEMERIRYDQGLPRLSDRMHAEFRQAELGLDTTNELAFVRLHAIAKLHSKPVKELRPAVRLIVAGEEDLARLEEDVAILLNDELVYSRKPATWAATAWDFKALVVRQWCQAVGATSAGQRQVIEGLIEQHRRRILNALPAEPYANLDPQVLDFARQVVTAQFGDRPRLVFYFWRCLSRIAAYEKNGRSIWRSEWLRGEKAHQHAIPGAAGSNKQSELTNLILGNVLDKAKGHSGAKGQATEFMLRQPIPRGSMDFRQAAARLGLKVDDTGKLKR